MSRKIFSLLRWISFFKALNPGALSTQTSARLCGFGRIWEIDCISAVRNVPCSSSLCKDVIVKDENDCGLGEYGEEVDSIPDRALDSKDPQEASGFLGELVTNGCEEQTNQETGEYVEELENVPGFPPDNKTKIKPDKETNDRSELFRVLENSEDSQDDYLSILT